MTGWVEKLDAATVAVDSLLCVGLDPDPSRIPIDDVFDFNRSIVDATSDLVCAYKPQLAFYEALGGPGLEIMVKTVAYIRSAAPGVVIIGDAKRGDVPSTAHAYAHALFDVWDFDVTTVNPYLGRDSIEPFTMRHDRGALILTRTSNPGAQDLQDLKLSKDGSSVPLYEHVGELAFSCNERGNVGLIMGATYPEQLAKMRARHPRMPILIPGIGAQGGGLADSVRFGADKDGLRAIISSSRSILYSCSDPATFAVSARRAATSLRDAIRVAVRSGDMHSE